MCNVHMHISSMMVDSQHNMDSFNPMFGLLKLIFQPMHSMLMKKSIHNIYLHSGRIGRLYNVYSKWLIKPLAILRLKIMWKNCIFCDGCSGGGSIEYV